MNNGFTPEVLGIVNIYGSTAAARSLPGARIVACGQKRSNDMTWSQKIVDLAGKNFDVLGVQHYDTSPRTSKPGYGALRVTCQSPGLYVRYRRTRNRIGVLEWNLSRTYDWRADSTPPAV